MVTSAFRTMQRSNHIQTYFTYCKPTGAPKATAPKAFSKAPANQKMHGLLKDNFLINKIVPLKSNSLVIAANSF